MKRYLQSVYTCERNGIGFTVVIDDNKVSVMTTSGNKVTKSAIPYALFVQMAQDLAKDVATVAAVERVGLEWSNEIRLGTTD